MKKHLTQVEKTKQDLKLLFSTIGLPQTHPTKSIGPLPGNMGSLNSVCQLILTHMNTLKYRLVYNGLMCLILNPNALVCLKYYCSSAVTFQNELFKEN